jgi:nucleoside permease NupC
MTDTVSRLVRACNSERDKRTDFPTIWTTILKPHPFVVGLPVQERSESGPVLRIPLLTGRFLVFDGSAFSLA